MPTTHSRRRYNRALMIAALALGLLLSLQWHSGPSQGNGARNNDQVTHTIQRLEAEQRELKATIGELRRQLDALQQQRAADTQLLEDISTELMRQKALAGLLPMRGPGVRVILDDGQASSPEPGMALIHAYDLRDVVNLLWMAGSEAVSINEERVVASTSIYCVGSTVMVNDTRMAPPFVIQAIGDPAAQEDLLRNPAYLPELKDRVHRYGARFDIQRATDLRIPAYQGHFAIQYARPGGQE